MAFNSLPSVRESTSAPYERESMASTRDTLSGLPPYEQRDTTILGASFSLGHGSGAATGLRLEPIKSTGGGNAHTSAFDFGPPRDRRASQDEIRALLQRTTTALDKIVRIRESMEPFVDFKQFEKPPRGSSASSTATARLSSSRGSHERLSHRSHGPPARMSSGPVLLQQDHTRTTPASSYGSATASSSSEDPLGRSTNSTHSSLGDDDASDARTHESPRRGVENVENSNSDDLDDERESGNDTFDDSDSSLSTMSTTDVPPLKEARLERLKTIEIAFHEGLPKEFFQALARFLYATIEVKTRHSRFNFYKDAFTGGDAVKELVVNGFAEDQSTAQRYGNVLVRLGYIEHVSRTDDQLHNSKDNFYRFTKALEYDDGDYLAGSPSSAHSRMSITASNYRESVLSRESSGPVEYDFSTASDDVHALVTDEVLQILSRVLLKVFERKNKLLFYKGFVGCFLGAEAVNVIRELRIATSLIDAVLVGQSLLDDGIVEPIATSVTTFQDKYVFYRLTKVRS